MGKIIDFNDYVNMVPQTEYDSSGIIFMPIIENGEYSSQDVLSFLASYPDNKVEIVSSLGEDTIPDPNTNTSIKCAVFDFKGHYGTNYILVHLNKVLTVMTPLKQEQE